MLGCVYPLPRLTSIFSVGGTGGPRVLAHIYHTTTHTYEYMKHSHISTRIKKKTVNLCGIKTIGNIDKISVSDEL